MTALLSAGGKLIFAGFSLGIGFWMSKKLTNIIDEKLSLYDNSLITRLGKQMDLSNSQTS